jgi:protein farnesyltransferase/geranylgeranyltransferase type-1 subunit alpha
MDYFRAVLRADEQSERALGLLGELIDINAASYTAWHFRRLVLDSLNSDLVAERAWLTSMASDNPKNYQLWFHRRWVVDKLNDGADELSFCAAVLAEDGKNYHAWAHRQWALKRFDLWAGELDWIDLVLQVDRRNNSAWNQRYFVVTEHEAPVTDELRRREIDYALAWIRKSPNNQSPWSYLSAFIKDADLDSIAPTLIADVQEMAERYVTCPHAPSLLIDLYERSGNPALVEQALPLCDLLATRLAQIHSKYWLYRKSLLSSQVTRN